MNSTLHGTNGNLTPSSWMVDQLREVRDVLLAEGREPLARAVSEVVGALLVQDPPLPKRGPIRPLLEVLAERGLLDDEPDYEDSAPLTPLDVLAADFVLPSISGGAPFEPSDQDWQDYADWCDGRLDERDLITVTGCC